MAEAQGLVIEGSAIEALMVKAILEAWSPEQRNALVSEAISTLFAKTHVTGFGRDRTVIEVAMAEGAKKAAINVIAEMLESEPYKSKLYSVLVEEFEKVLQDPEEGTSPIRQGIAQGLAKHITTKATY